MGWLANYSESERNVLYGKALINLFPSITENLFISKLSETDHEEVYNKLFTKQQIEITVDGRDALQHIWTALPRELASLMHWKVIKEKLLPFNPNFKLKENHGGYDVLNEISLRTSWFLESSLHDEQARMQGIEIIKDMIKFAWDRGGFEEITEGKSTPLHECVESYVSCKSEYEKIIFSPVFVDHLIKLGHPLNIQDSYGNTPLHLAITKNRTEMALCLLDANAKIDIKNKSGQTPKDIALSSNNLILLARMSHTVSS